MSETLKILDNYQSYLAAFKKLKQSWAQNKPEDKLCLLKDNIHGMLLKFAS